MQFFTYMYKNKRFYLHTNKKIIQKNKINSHHTENIIIIIKWIENMCVAWSRARFAMQKLVEMKKKIRKKIMHEWKRQLLGLLLLLEWTFIVYIVAATSASYCLLLVLLYALQLVSHRNIFDSIYKCIL